MGKISAALASTSLLAVLLALASCERSGQARSVDAAHVVVVEDGGAADAVQASDAGAADAAAPDAGGAEDAAGSDALPACPSFAAPVTHGTVMHSSVIETSGVVASRKNPGLLWVHNDSGDGPQVFGISETGQALATCTLAGISATDWEDIAAGPGPAAGESYLYLGDIGDNTASRSGVQLYRVVEPLLEAGAGVVTLSLDGVERFDLVYPDGAHNAETLLVDPRSGDVYIVTKASSGLSQVFCAAAPLASGSATTVEQVAALTFGAEPLPGNTTTTGGDITAAGDAIAIRTYSSAFLWRRAEGASVADALATAPCPIPLAVENQGEALGFAADDSGYYTLSEGAQVELHFCARR